MNNTITVSMPLEEYDRMRGTITAKDYKIKTLQDDIDRLTREIESLQMQHRNDQGLD